MKYTHTITIIISQVNFLQKNNTEKNKKDELLCYSLEVVGKADVISLMILQP